MEIKNAFKILIVDDEPEACHHLKSIAEEIGHVEVIGTAAHAEEALYKLVEHYPDLVLLDINMPCKNGIEFIQLINKRNIDVPVVLVSAFKDYAIQAIRNGVYDYLLKPVCPDDLEAIVTKYQRAKKRDLPGKLMHLLNSIKEERKIRINSRHSYILINPREIVYCISEDGYTTLQLANGNQEVSNTSLSQLEATLHLYNFYRLGRSFLINLEYIREIDKKTSTCLLEHKNQNWTVNASQKSVAELLKNNFGHA